jgi:hypothetical protein
MIVTEKLFLLIIVAMHILIVPVQVCWSAKDILLALATPRVHASVLALDRVPVQLVRISMGIILLQTY